MNPSCPSKVGPVEIPYLSRDYHVPSNPLFPSSLSLPGRKNLQDITRDISIVRCEILVTIGDEGSEGARAKDEQERLVTLSQGVGSELGLP